MICLLSPHLIYLAMWFIFSPHNMYQFGKGKKLEQINSTISKYLQDTFHIILFIQHFTLIFVMQMKNYCASKHLPSVAYGWVIAYLDLSWETPGLFSSGPHKQLQPQSGPVHYERHQPRTK